MEVGLGNQSKPKDFISFLSEASVCCVILSQTVAEFGSWHVLRGTSLVFEHRKSATMKTLWKKSFGYITHRNRMGWQIINALRNYLHIGFPHNVFSTMKIMHFNNHKYMADKQSPGTSHHSSLQFPCDCANKWRKRKPWNLPLCRIQRVITLNWPCSQAFISLCTDMLCTHCQCVISGERGPSKTHKQCSDRFEPQRQ